MLPGTTRGAVRDDPGEVGRQSRVDRIGSLHAFSKSVVKFCPLHVTLGTSIPGGWEEWRIYLLLYESLLALRR